jgi:hypothetical protein
MSNPFSYQNQINTTGLIKDMVPITLNDNADNVGTDNVAVGLYNEGAGNITFITNEGTERVVAVPANFYLLCSIKRVKFTGTTVTGTLHALVV